MQVLISLSVMSPKGSNQFQSFKEGFKGKKEDHAKGEESGKSAKWT